MSIDVESFMNKGLEDVSCGRLHPANMSFFIRVDKERISGATVIVIPEERRQRNQPV